MTNPIIMEIPSIIKRNCSDWSNLDFYRGKYEAFYPNTFIQPLSLSLVYFYNIFPRLCYSWSLYSFQNLLLNVILVFMESTQNIENKNKINLIRNSEKKHIYIQLTNNKPKQILFINKINFLIFSIKFINNKKARQFFYFEILKLLTSLV